MNTLKQLIHIFSEEERKQFLVYLKKKNRRGDTKNVQLFQLIAQGKTNDIDRKLYGKPNRNAYHALSKRLQDALIDFVATQSFAGETSEELAILKLLLASRIFFEQKQYKIAFKTLARAENQAMEYDIYAILNEIYHTKIQYAHLHPTLELTQCIEASQKNLASFLQEQQMNNVYATIKNKIQKEPNLPINTIIEDAFKHFNSNIDKTLTYKSLFQLMNVTVTAANLQHNYYEIVPFMNRLFSIVSEKKELINKHLYYHLEISLLMAGMHFRNKNFSTSTSILKSMLNDLKLQNGKYISLFKERHIVLKSLNLLYTGKVSDALNSLHSFQKYSLSISMTKLLCYFQQGHFKEAYSLFKTFNHSDAWYEKKMGWVWVIKKSIIEILILIELDKLDLVLLRLQSFKKRFSKKLNTQGESRTLTFVQLISLFYENPKMVTTPSFSKKVEHSFDWIGREKEDIFVMSFYAWLKAKMENRNLYEVTLELVAK